MTGRRKNRCLNTSKRHCRQKAHNDASEESSNGREDVKRFGDPLPHKRKIQLSKNGYLGRRAYISGVIVPSNNQSEVAAGVPTWTPNEIHILGRRQKSLL